MTAAVEELLIATLLTDNGQQVNGCFGQTPAYGIGLFAGLCHLQTIQCVRSAEAAYRVRIQSPGFVEFRHQNHCLEPHDVFQHAHFPAVLLVREVVNLLA